MRIWLRSDPPDITLRAVTWDNQLVSSVAAFFLDGRTEVTYWIDRAAWGHSIASRAVELLLDLEPVAGDSSRRAYVGIAAPDPVVARHI